MAEKRSRVAGSRSVLMLLVVALVTSHGCVASPPPPLDPELILPQTLELKTAEVHLRAEPLVQQNQGYVATFGSQGHLRKIDIPQEAKALVYFVRKGHSAEDCLDLNAVVPVYSGQSATPVDLKLIYGTPKPSLPVEITACLGVETKPESFAITVGYTEGVE